MLNVSSYLLYLLPGDVKCIFRDYGNFVKKTSHKGICQRIAQLRLETAGARGKSAFAKNLGLSPSTYDYYETSRVPPADVLVRIAEVTGADLRWLLTGRESPEGAAPFDHPILRRAAALLADRPEAAAPLAAFLDILIEVGKFPAKTARSRAAGEERTGTVEGPAKRQAAVEAAAREATHAAREAARAGGTAREGWIPILGRSAAGVPHFWAAGEAAGLTTLEELVSRHAAAAAANVQPATAAGAEGNEESPVQIITLSVPDGGDVVQFVAAPQIKARWADAFALRIDGDSMAPDIRHGDLAIVSPGAAAADGRAAIVQLEGQIGVTCKLFSRREDVVHLVPVNDRYEIATFPAGQLVWALRVLARVRS